MTVGLDKSESGGRYCPTCEKTFATGDRCPDDDTRLVKLAKDGDQLLGRELDGRYTIVDKIGRGGMGTVYRARQHGLGREVAIKVVTPSLVSEPVVIKRFLREAKLASRLSHPNAVSVLDFGQTDDGLFYLVMELVNGRTLDVVIAERPLAPVRVVRIGAQICDALEGAHALQIIHRDLKPSNVILMAASRDLVKVLDFGLAKSLSPDASTATMTNAGALVGTPAFMPPEAVTGGVVDIRSDLYSLGCILYTALSGKLPFQTSSVPELIAMHASEPVPPIVGAPVGLARVIERLLAKDPSARYQDAASTREALEASLAASNEVVAARSDSGSEARSATVLGWSTPASGMPRTPSTPASGVKAANPPARPGVQPAARESRPADRSVDVAMPSPAAVVTAREKITDAMTSSPTVIAREPSKPIVPPSAMVAHKPAARSSMSAVWIIIVMVVLAAGGVAVYMTLRSDATAPTTTPSAAPASAPAPVPAPAPAPSQPPPTESPTAPTTASPTAPSTASTPPSTSAPPAPPSSTPAKPPARPKRPPRSNEPPPPGPVRLNPGIGGN